MFRFLSCIPVNHRSLWVDKWTLGELIAGVGDIDRSAAFKALVTWVNMGVLKENPENMFVLLGRAEEDVSGKMTPEEWGVSVGTFWLLTYSFIGACADWWGLMQDLNHSP